MLGEEGFTHPPLYEAMLALLFKLFGETELAARAFGIFCFLAVGVLLSFIYLHLARGEEPVLKKAGLLVCLVLYGLNPLLIQHSMLIDAESTCTYVFTAAFVCVFIRTDHWRGGRYAASRLLLAAIFAFAFFGKEVTPFFLLFGALFYRLVNREWKRFLLEIVLIGAAGVGLIALGAWAYQALTGESFIIFLNQQYKFRVARTAQLAFFFRVLKNLQHLLRWPVFWISASLFMWFLAAFGLRLAAFVRTRRLTLADYCFGTGVLIWVPYLLFKPSVDMMKYQYPAYPLLIAAAVWYGVEAFRPHRAALEAFLCRYPRVMPGVMVLSFVTAFYYQGLGDYILLMFTPAKDPSWRMLASAYWMPMIGALIVWAVWSLYNRKAAVAAFAGTCLFFTIPVNAALNYRQIAPYTTVESWLNYGEKGFVETVEYLAENTGPDASIVARDDLKYYLEYRYHKPLRTFFTLREFFLVRDPRALDRIIREGNVKFIVIDSVSLSYVPIKNNAGVMLMRHYRPDRDFGSFRVFRHKESA